MKKFLLSIVVALLASLSASANDGLYTTSGNQLVPLKKTNISVKKEILTIDISRYQMAVVDVYYEFYNPGKTSQTVLMGFEADPPYNTEKTFSANGVHPYIHNFTVEINGQKLGHKNALADSDKPFKPLDGKQWKFDEESMGSIYRKDNKNIYLNNYAYVYYFDATFKPGLNRVHHTYTYDMSMTVGTSYEFVYKLSPAARWANKRIDDFTLCIKTDNPKHFVMNKKCIAGVKPTVASGKGKIRDNAVYDEKMWEVAMNSGELVFHKQNFVPSKEHELQLHSADIMHTFNDDSRFGAYYDRNNQMALYVYGQREEKDMSEDLFWRVAKNLPFAHRGYIFKDQQLSKYFNSLFWYMPDASYDGSTTDFTENDRAYVKCGTEKKLPED